jgi:hypothetical protein
MGKVVSRLCIDCFKGSESAEPLLADHHTEVALVPLRLRTDLASPLKESPQLLEFPRLAQDDLASPYDKLAADISSQFLDKVLHPNLEGFDCIQDKDDIKVLVRDSSNGFVIWSEYKVPFTPEQLLTFSAKIDHRKEWDSNIEEVRLVCQAGENSFISYFIFKQFLVVSSRDLVLFSTYGHHGASMFEASASIDHDEFPVSKKHVRAKMHLRGLLVTPIGAEESRVVEFNEIDIGGYLPRSLMKKLSGMLVPRGIAALCKACKKDSKGLQLEP